MRSSKSRSRKSNRNRSVGNIVNRVFDSSGPEGKVRGTPQQIIDKYNQLARDAQLSGDRVATENFQQHAEHYLRMLAEAQREQDQKREQQEQENRQRQADRDRERAQRQDKDGNGNDGQSQPDQQAQQQPARSENSGQSDVLGVMETSEETEDTGLVETPESKAPEAKPKRAPRSRAKKPKKDEASDAPDEGAQTAAE